MRLMTTLLAFSLSMTHADSCSRLFASSFEASDFHPPLQCRPITDAEAAKFLTQATFGPTYDSIATLKKEGYDAWFDRQIKAKRSKALPKFDGFVEAADDIEKVYFAHLHGIWFNHVLYGPDQLRQRVAYALSQIFVVSSKSTLNTASLSVYHDMLVDHAFGNYRDLLESVTVSPAMGVYLSMRQNRKPGLGTNNTEARKDLRDDARPDENYAREIMQLFSIGLVMLNQDGTVKLKDGKPIPTYTQETIKGFAHVFTGWNFGSCKDPKKNKWYKPDNHQAPFLWWHWNWCPEIDDKGTDEKPIKLHRYLAKRWRMPMKPWGEGTDYADAYHAKEGSKQLLVYPGVSLSNGVLPAGGTARTNLKKALDNIFNHPNVPPFMAFRLIQRLTTSNPSPAYVKRVADVFVDNGKGVRGDLKATIKAILMDPEAREPARAPAHFGKLREPAIRVATVFRAFNGQSKNGGFYEKWISSRTQQMLLDSPSVFNYYLPHFQPAGVVQQKKLYAPVMQMMTDSQINTLSRYLEGKVYWDSHFGTPDPKDDATRLLLNFKAFLSMMDDPKKLVDELALLLTYDTLSEADRKRYINMLENDRYSKSKNDWTRQLRMTNLVNLIINSPAFIVETH